MITFCEFTEACYELQSILPLVAPDHYPSRYAPDSWERLSLFKERGTAPLPVWDSASEYAIYGGPQGNYAFRAWHDQTHLDMGADFSLEGEIAVALEQATQARMFGVSELAIRVLIADTIGQLEHFEAYGEFPKYQSAFVFDYVRGDIVY